MNLTANRERLRGAPRFTRRARGLAARAALAMAIVGCLAAGKETEIPTPIFWPPPPAEPRIAYVETISQPSDLGIRSSWWSRFWGTVTGKKLFEGLSKPLGIALGDDGVLGVTDPGANVVYLFDPARNKCRRWEKMGGRRFVSPVSIAIAGDTVFVADSALQKVIAAQRDGKFLFDLDHEFQRPAGLAIGGRKLFVADALAHRILVFDLQGRFLSQFGRRGVAPGEFNFPTHLAVGGEKRLYVTDSMNSRVQVFDLEGRPLGVIGSAGDSSGHFSKPKGVAVDRWGHVYVVDALFDNIQIFDEAGRFLLAFGTAGAEPGEFWLPTGIVADGDDRFYVADSYNHRIQVFKYVGK